MNLTERGQREVGNGLKEAVDHLNQRMSNLQAQIGLLEAELSGLGKIKAALLMAAELVRSRS